MSKLARLALAVTFVLLSSVGFADDLTGQDHLLCSAGTVTACSEDGDCFKGTAFDFNVPEFVEVDLQAKRMNTTEASGPYRSTAINHITRENGFILLQGSEGGRAFSFLINEPAGLLTVAVAIDGISIAIFGNCTPMPVSK